MPTRADRTRQAIEREAQVIAWQSQGMTTAEMGRRLGCSQQWAHELWTRALNRRPTANLEQHRRSQVELINSMKVRLIAVLDNPKTTPRTLCEAVSTMRGLMEREARLLGLDAVQRSEVKVITEDTVDAAIHDLRAEMALQAQQAGLKLPELR